MKKMKVWEHWKLNYTFKNCWWCKRKVTGFLVYVFCANIEVITIYHVFFFLVRVGIKFMVDGKVLCDWFIFIAILSTCQTPNFLNAETIFNKVIACFHDPAIKEGKSLLLTLLRGFARILLPIFVLV